jgi:hypothetical protein
MTGRLALITGIGFGAGLMYILDPAMGRRRRALARDKTIHCWKKTSEAVGSTARDVTNRAAGLSQKLRSSFARENSPSDDVLVQRVRSRTGHVVSHPRAIDVSAAGGQITLRGPVFQAEVDRLLSSVAEVPGVDRVENLLEVHETAENVPVLQGGIEQDGKRLEFLPRIWSPVMIATSGGVLAFYGWNRRDQLGVTCRKLGLGMLARGWMKSRRRRSWIKNLSFVK